MGTLARLIQRAVQRRVAPPGRAGYLLVLLPLLPVLVIGGLIGLLVLFAVASSANPGCGATPPISAPGQNIRTATEVVRYLESQGIAANGAAGIEGNLQQESQLNPGAGGGGLAQWGPSWYATMAVYATGRGLDPTSMAGQLTYLVYDLRTAYGTLLANLNAAPDPETAARMFETGYEKCSGVIGYMRVVPGSLCDDPARRGYAAAALQGAAGSVPVAYVAGGACVAVGGGFGDPIPGFTPGRDDMGVDACAQPGAPIVAPADSTLARVIPNWYQGQLLEVFVFSPPLTGTYLNDQYWYVAEQILPVTTTIGTTFSAGQPVAWYASIGSCIEIGWGSMTTNSGTLVPADTNPPPGALTQEAEAFKTYFHIPWIGRSP